MNDLRELRHMAGWTQMKTAHASGINRAKLSQAECREIQLSQQEEAAVRRVLIVAIQDRAARIDGVLASVSRAPKSEQEAAAVTATSVQAD